jgi:hypothetical protein
MKRLIIVILLVGLIYVAGTMVFSEIKTYMQNASLILSGTNTETMRTTVLDHYNTHILKGKSTLPQDVPITLVTEHINTDGILDIIATVNSEATCGSGGCITTIFLQDTSGNFAPISFGYAVKEISVEQTITQGMHDISINNNTETPLTWNGHTYTLNEF